jgi:hypothetical protein
VETGVASTFQRARDAALAMQLKLGAALHL